MNNLPPDFERQLDQFLRLAGKQALLDPTPEDFALWFATAAPKSLPAWMAQMPAKPSELSRFMRVASLSLYGELPLPGKGWAASGQRKQERNAPCGCASGRKYKHCCGALAMPSLFGNLNLLRYVLDACPKRRLPEIATSKASIEAVSDTAWQWQDEGDPARAAALLEPFFLSPGPLGERLAPLFNLLMDAWLALRRGVKRERLIDEILLRGDKVLRSDALQRRTTMLADKGDHAAAWRTFKQAAALNPNDPALGFLEVSTLVSEGRVHEAQGRAQWWAASLARLRDPSLADLVDRLRGMAKDPHAGMLSAGLQSNEGWRRLHDLFMAAPAATVRHAFEVFTETDGRGGAHQVVTALLPDAALVRLEERWQQVFAQQKPAMAAVQNDAEHVWGNAVEWLDLLRDHPDLWFSFDVLDDLVMAVDTMRVAGVLERLLVPMAERAAQQLRLTLASGGHGAVECHWAVWPNRPALRPVAHLAYLYKETADWQRFMEVAHWMVFELNPADNHGLRADLSSVCVRFSRWADVMAIDKRFGRDSNPTLSLNALLSSFVLGDNQGAHDRMRTAARDYPMAVEMLLEHAPQPVAPSGDLGIIAGGMYDAWVYASAMRPYWEQHHALDWARSVMAAPKRGGRAAPPDQTGLF